MSSIPSATVSRLVTYLRILTDLHDKGVVKTSSDHLSREAHVSAFQVRKDLAYFGRFGTRGAGYSVDTLHRELRRILGLTRAWNVAIVGMGRLGEALADYPALDQYDFVLSAAFDVDPAKIGRTIAGLEVRAMDSLASSVQELSIDMAFLTVPSPAAQPAADALGAAGIRGILNFAPTVIDPPSGVHVERVDFLAGLKRLSFYIFNPKSKEETA